jgi:hypothetical protein
MFINYIAVLLKKKFLIFIFWENYKTFINEYYVAQCSISAFSQSSNPLFATVEKFKVKNWFPDNFNTDKNKLQYLCCLP